MKNKFENIDEMFQKTFDGFEANVDPSVWSNVSNSINGGLASSSASTSVVATKSVMFKIIAGVVALTTIATSAYFLTKEKIVNENTIAQETAIAQGVEQENQALVLKEKVPSQKIDVVEEENKVIAQNVVSNENKTEINNQEISENIAIDNSNNEISKEAESNPSKIKESTSVPVVKKSEKTNSAPPNKGTIEEEVFEVSILSTVTEGYAPLEVEFNIDGDIVSCAWDFNDGATSNQETAFHTFDKPGKYVVSLNVLDKNNRDKKITKTIVVKSNFPSSLEPIQNVFSPNGDNQNDVLKINGENIQKLEVFIMDVNGNLVGTLRSIDAEWDFRDQTGRIVNPGTYIVSGSAKGVDGEIHIIKKMITLFK